MSQCLPRVFLDAKAVALRKIAGRFGWGEIDDAFWRVTDISHAISEEAQIQMPPVLIDSFGWHMPGEGVIAGQAAPVNLFGAFEWTVRIPISAPLLMTHDADLRRLLVHEFSHVFSEVVRLLTGLPFDREDRDGWPLSRQLEHAQQEDRARLADPGDWFGESDAQDFLFQTEGDTMISRYVSTFTAVWLQRDLPVRMPELRYSVTGRVVAAGSIIERAKSMSEVMA